jgi:hypothetical protein
LFDGSSVSGVKPNAARNLRWRLMKQDILVCALFSNQFTAHYNIMPEFPLIKTMLISDYLLSMKK